MHNEDHIDLTRGVGLGPRSAAHYFQDNGPKEMGAHSAAKPSSF
jgi:hypothetical protein